MKNFTTILIAALVLCFGNCKKDSNNNNGTGNGTSVLPCDSNTATFTIDLGNTGPFIDVLEDEGKNVVAFSNNRVLKYDYRGNLLWDKSIDIKGGMGLKAIEADNGSYFYVSATNNFEGVFYRDNVISPVDLELYSYWRAMDYFLPYCKMRIDHIIKPANMPDRFTARSKPPVNNSRCLLQKLNSNGNLIWEKSFPGTYLMKNPITRMSDGNYLLLTYVNSGFYQRALFDANGVFTDSLQIPINENALTLYKLTPDGNVLWSNSYNNIVQYNQNESRFWSRVVDLDHNIIIQTADGVLTLDMNGKELSRSHPYNNDCMYQAMDLAKQGQLMYSNIAYLDTSGRGSAIRRIICKNASWSTLSTFDVDLEGFWHEGLYKLAGNAHFISGRKNLRKYSRTGSLLWDKQVERVLCMDPTCKDGLLYIYQLTGGGNYLLVKTDENGN